MERGPSFESPRQRRSEFALSDAQIMEYLRDPENARELLDFWNYIDFIQSLIPQNTPSREQEALERAIHREIEMTA